MAEFLLRHNVRTVLGEYLDTSHIYIKTMKKLGLRFVAHGHGYDISKLAKNPKWQKRFMEFNDAAGVVTINNISRERLAGCGIAPEKIHLIPYGVDVPPSYPDNRRTSIDENRPVRCLAVGRLVPKKAPLELLESFRLARKVFPRLQLDIVGDGPLREAVSSYIEEHGLGAHVALHGRKPNEYVRELFSSVDIFLQHSITDPRTGDEEGLPVAILEAMAHGLPVVSTRHAGIPDEVVDNVNGYLVEENDVQTMADRIVKISAEHELRAKMGEAGWRRAAEKFSWKGERRELLKVLDLD